MIPRPPARVIPALASAVLALLLAVGHAGARINRLKTADPPGPALPNQTNDAAGHLLSETLSQPSQPTRLTAYSYDPAANRASRTFTEDGVTVLTTYTYNAANQLIAWSDGARAASLTYDERGNRASQEITVAGDSTQVTAYTWDHQNCPSPGANDLRYPFGILSARDAPKHCLTGVTTPDGAQHHYTYDYRTRRIGRAEPSGITAITHTGGLALAEYAELVGCSTACAEASQLRTAPHG